MLFVIKHSKELLII